MVTVYSGAGCPQCIATKKYLDSLHVEYVVKDVSNDKEALEHITSLGIRQIPVIEKGEQRIIGFDPVKIEALAA